MFFGGEVEGAHEVVGKLLAGMGLLPLGEDGGLFFVYSQATLADIGPEVEGLDPGGGTHHSPYRAGGGLGEQGDVADPLGSDLLASLIGEPLDKLSIQIGLNFKAGEGAFLHG